MSSKVYLSPTDYIITEHTCVDRTPYCYLIGWVSLNLWYYGVRYGKSCHPSDLFVSYFTSSKEVSKSIKSYGVPDVIQIRKVFYSKESAINHENKVINRLDMVKKDNWLNRCRSKCISSYDTCKHSIGRTYEEIYGEEKAKKLRESRANSNRNRAGKVKFKCGSTHGNSKNAVKEITKEKTRTDYDKSLKIPTKNAGCAMHSECIICGNTMKQRKNKRYCSKKCGNVGYANDQKNKAT